MTGQLFIVFSSAYPFKEIGSIMSEPGEDEASVIKRARKKFRELSPVIQSQESLERERNDMVAGWSGVKRGRLPFNNVN